MYMLDTDTCSYILRSKPAAVRERFKAQALAELCISEVVLAELLYGAARETHRTNELRALVDEFASRLTVLPWNAARAYGDLRAALEALGTPIGNMDTLIAAHALTLGATLVTNNAKHFSRVTGLRLENWVE